MRSSKIPAILLFVAVMLSACSDDKEPVTIHNFGRKVNEFNRKLDTVTHKVNKLNDKLQQYAADSDSARKFREEHGFSSPEEEDSLKNINDMQGKK